MLQFFFKRKTLPQVHEWVTLEIAKHKDTYARHVEITHQRFPALLDTTHRNLVALKTITHPDSRVREALSLLYTITSSLLTRLKAPVSGPDFSEFDILLERYSEQCKQPLAILHPLNFAHLAALGESINAIETTVTELRRTYELLNKYTSIGGILSDMAAIGAKREKCERKLAELSERIQTLEQQRQELLSRKEQLTQTPAYQAVKDSLLTAASERKDAANSIMQTFRPIMHIIEDYAHATNNSKIMKYAEDPVLALSSDYSFIILNHKDALLSHAAKRAEHTIPALNRLDKPHLSNLLHRYANSRKHEQDAQNKIAHEPFIADYEAIAVALKNNATELETCTAEKNAIALPSDTELCDQLDLVLSTFRIRLKRN